MSVTLSPSQQTAMDAFRQFLHDPAQEEFLLSGFAGSGKSFLVNHLIDVVNREHKVEKLIDSKASLPAMYFTATTNKAAYVLQNMLNKPTDTIHKLLGLSVLNDYKKGTKELYQKTDSRNLNYSIVFIDEASMVTRDLLHIIRTTVAKFTNTKVVYIGDSYQLPPVKESSCPVFQTNMPKYFLTEIQRQAANSPIIQLASQYRLMLDNPTAEWPIIVPDNKSIFHYTVKEDWFKAVQNGFMPSHTIDDVKVLAWSNDRVREYNAWIRNFKGQTGDFALGETVQTNKPIQFNDKIFASTDSAHTITHISTDCRDDVEGYLIELSDVNTMVANTVFQPKDWKDATKLVSNYKKNKEWRAMFEIQNEWADLRAVHAQTVHKSQGSTYRNVYIDLTNIGKNNKWQEVARMVYVAITRASNAVHIFGNLENRYNKTPVINRQEIFQNAAATG